MGGGCFRFRGKPPPLPGDLYTQRLIDGQSRSGFEEAEAESADAEPEPSEDEADCPGP